MSKKYISETRTQNTEHRTQKKKQSVRAEVVSAVPLSKGQQRTVVRWVKRNVGRDIELRAGVDPRVIAGIRVRAGDWLFDGTFQGELERFKNTLATS